MVETYKTAYDGEKTPHGRTAMYFVRTARQTTQIILAGTF